MKENRQISAPVILLIAIAFATIGMAIYTYTAAASGSFDLASHAAYVLQPSIMR
jgi:hypothetical protein